MTNKISKKLTVFLLVFSLLFSGTLSTSVYSVTDAEKQQIEDYKSKQLELEKKIEEAKAVIERLKKDKADKEAYVEQLAVQIENYQRQIDVLNVAISKLEIEKADIQIKIDKLNAEITGIQENIEENEAQTSKTEQEIDNIYSLLKNRLCDVYVNRATSELELLLDLDESDDFAVYLIVMELSRQLARRDKSMIETLDLDIEKLERLTSEYNKMIDGIKVKRSEHQTQVNELNSKENEIVNSRTKLKESQTSLEALQAEAYEYIAQLDTDCKIREKLIADYEAQIKAFEKKIDKIINSASKGSGKGDLIWPLQYNDVYISSSFGYRSDPATGATRFHGGTDTCCWSGTYGKEVSAAAAGTVIIATYNSGGYGYYVGIDHGNGLVTIYAHNSQLLVSVGQHVKQGQTIAYAGSTGYSTGPHVHFEVRVNGKKINPTSRVPMPG